MDPICNTFLDDGSTAIDQLPAHAQRLAKLIAEKFPKMSLEQVGQAMASAASTESVNAKVAALGVLVREEAAQASFLFRQCEMWLYLKQPAVSDGNNFGVDVQNYVLGELKAMRTEMDAMLITGRDYHWSRGQGIDKLFGDAVEESSTSESTKKEDGKTTTTSSSDTGKKSKKVAGMHDYKEYVVSVDVRAYHHAFTQLTEMRNFYVRAHALFAKNAKRLADPRGEGSDGAAHSMSMF